jgi:hypothetical protein
MAENLIKPVRLMGSRRQTKSKATAKYQAICALSSLLLVYASTGCATYHMYQRGGKGGYDLGSQPVEKRAAGCPVLGIDPGGLRC